MPRSVRDFETWAPLLAFLWAGGQQSLSSPGVFLAGHVDHRGGYGWTVPQGADLLMSPGILRKVAEQLNFDPIAWIREPLVATGMNYISYVAEFPSPGRAVIHVLEFGPAVEITAGGIGLGSLVLVDGALPEPWRRTPTRAPQAKPAKSGDPALLERTLRQRLPGAIGATEDEIAAAEARIGRPLPAELRTFYEVTRGRWADWAVPDDEGSMARQERIRSAFGCFPLPIEQVYLADVPTRSLPWIYAATEVASTPADAAVQRIVGSPGWIVFGDTGGGDRLALDLTPGPRGHLGQVIVINHDESIGADLLADSLTSHVLRPKTSWTGAARTGLPAAAMIHSNALRSVAAAANPDLEVLQFGVWEGAPFSLAPVAGLPRLRTLTAYPGTLADPLEVTGLPALEFLALSPDDWRTLLDADAVPRTLLAAAVDAHDGRNPLQDVTVANELLARWNRPLITETILEGDITAAL